MTFGKMKHNNKPLPKSAFKDLVPHKGTMLLIDEVKSWTQAQIITGSHSHQNPDNPLRLKGKLSSIHLIEYGAQSMAIHCGLLTGEIHAGFLASVKNAQFYIDDLDSITSELIICANAELQMPKGAIYHYSITDIHQTLLLEAHATVIHLASSS